MPFERAEQQLPVLAAQLEAIGGLAQDAAERLRADRQVFGVERRLAGEHAEALAEQVERQAVADFGAAADFGEHRGFVEVEVLDERHLAGAEAKRAGGVLAARRVLDAGEPGFERDQVARHQVGTRALDQPLRLEPARLHHVVACLLGVTEQLLFEFVERRDQRALQFVGGVFENSAEQPAHPLGQRSRRQRRCRRVRSWCRCGHLPLRMDSPRGF